MPQQILHAGPLLDTGPRILQDRAEARAQHGWIMDIYLLRREPGAD
jgi:precorrin-6A synthase